MHSTVLLLTSILAVVQGQFLPYELGPYTVIKNDIRHNETLDLPYNLDIWSPVEAGSYPVLFLLDSFGGLTPGEAYGDVMNHVSSFGFVVINSWLIQDQPLVHPYKVPLVEQTIEWCKMNLEDFLYVNGVSDQLSINYSMSFAMGHSAGCHVFVDYLKIHCDDFKALVLSSPVDGMDPYGIIDIFTITPGEYLNFTMPTFVLPAGLDSVPGGNNSVSCAPEEMSNKRFWDALPPSSHKWWINSTNFGHADYLDIEFVDVVIARDFCSYNEEATDAGFATYRGFVGGQIVSFLFAVTEEDCSQYLEIIENVEDMPIEATAMNDKPTACPTPYCYVV